MAKSLRDAKPTTPDYFVGYMAERKKEVFEQRVVIRMPRIAREEKIWAEKYDPDVEAGEGAWGEFLEINYAIRLAKVMAKGIGLWDGHRNADWIKFAAALLGPLDCEWTMTIAEVARVWREVHPSPVS